jgi:uncharacterized protein (TIGR02996 family)
VNGFRLWLEATPDQVAMIKAVLHAPHDDLPKMVYADWLDDHGDDALAELTRVALNRQQFSPGRATRTQRKQSGVSLRDHNARLRQLRDVIEKRDYGQFAPKVELYGSSGRQITPWNKSRTTSRYPDTYRYYVDGYRYEYRPMRHDYGFNRMYYSDLDEPTVYNVPAGTVCVERSDRQGGRVHGQFGPLGDPVPPGQEPEGMWEAMYAGLVLSLLPRHLA